MRRPHRSCSPAQHRHLRNGAGGSFRYGSYPRNGRPPSAGVFVDLNSTGSQVFGTPRRVSQLFPRGTVIGTIPRICGRMPPPCAISTDGGGTKSIAGDGSSLDKSLRERLKESSAGQRLVLYIIRTCFFSFCKGKPRLRHLQEDGSILFVLRPLCHLQALPRESTIVLREPTALQRPPH